MPITTKIDSSLLHEGQIDKSWMGLRNYHYILEANRKGYKLPLRV